MSVAAWNFWERVAVAFIGTLPLLLAALGGFYLALKQANRVAASALLAAAKVAAKVEIASSKVEDVKTDLANSTFSTENRLDAIHTLVNGGLGVQLKIASVALRRVADLTLDRADREAADLAEKAYQDHENTGRTSS